MSFAGELNSQHVMAQSHGDLGDGDWPQSNVMSPKSWEKSGPKHSPQQAETVLAAPIPAHPPGPWADGEGWERPKGCNAVMLSSSPSCHHPESVTGLLRFVYFIPVVAK